MTISKEVNGKKNTYIKYRDHQAAILYKHETGDAIEVHVVCTCFNEDLVRGSISFLKTLSQKNEFDIGPKISRVSCNIYFGMERLD